MTEGGPPPYATTYLPFFVYRNAFEYLRYGYASAAVLTMFALTVVAVVVFSVAAHPPLAAGGGLVSAAGRAGAPTRSRPAGDRLADGDDDDLELVHVQAERLRRLLALDGDGQCVVRAPRRRLVGRREVLVLVVVPDPWQLAGGLIFASGTFLRFTFGGSATPLALSPAWSSTDTGRRRGRRPALGCRGRPPRRTGSQSPRCSAGASAGSMNSSVSVTEPSTLWSTTVGLNVTCSAKLHPLQRASAGSSAPAR